MDLDQESDNDEERNEMGSDAVKVQTIVTTMETRLLRMTRWTLCVDRHRDDGHRMNRPAVFLDDSIVIDCFQNDDSR
jgi:hypothetical protein